tara:strand:- start:371224 stop:371985 length:762 start_codon:yes stop_codon:yes gene_type:complete
MSVELIPGVGIALLGAVLASFVGVLAERINTGASWANDRSRCDSCSETLTARDLLPVLSWLLSLGRCRHCGSRVPLRHAVVEGATALAFFWAFYQFGITVHLGVFLVALLALLFVVLYDLRHTIVLMVPMGLFVLSALVFRVLETPDSQGVGLSLLLAGVCGSFFLAFHILSRGRAMGLGDAPMALGLSLLVGPAVVLPGVLFSFWIGALYGIAVLVSTPRGHRMGIEVPFVPFLALGFLLAYFTGWNPLLFI